MKIGVLKVGSIIDGQVEEIVSDRQLVAVDEEERKCRNRKALDEGQQEAELRSSDHIVDDEEVENITEEKEF